MRSILITVLLGLTICPFCKSRAYSDAPIYSNTIFSGYGDRSDTMLFDYGTTTGGLVKSLRILYLNDSYTTNTIRLEFFQYYSKVYYDMWGYRKTIFITNLPRTYGSFNVYEYVLPEADRFELPAGSFGFTAMMSTGIYWGLASGGTGNEDEMWEYDDWTGWYSFWYGGTPWAGLYLEIIKGPPIDEITCDIKGYKFDDQNGNGSWDAGEPALPHWEMYLDENGDGIYQPAEPNVVTDPNGMYFFENLDSPATYTVREIVKPGWTQTLPGGPDFEYVIDTEPNLVYKGYHFGNTTKVIPTDITISGYIRDGGSPLENVRVEAYENGTDPTGVIDTTDALGYYEITLPSPWTGSLQVYKPGYLFNDPVYYTNRTTNAAEDFDGTFLYGGGEGTEASPFEIWTAEQMNNIGQQPLDWDQHFILMADIDLAAYDGQAGRPEFTPIGYRDMYGATPFTGILDGNGHTIQNFTFVTYHAYRGGIFASLDAPGEIKNITMINPLINVPSQGQIAVLVSRSEGGTIRNCHVVGGTITGDDYIGPLVGDNWADIYECSASSPVTGTAHVGGLVGRNEGRIYRSLATGSVTGTTLVGGLTGRCVSVSGSYGIIQDCYATGDVSGTYTGGLVGQLWSGSIENSYSTGHVSGTDHAGGLVGEIVVGGVVTHSFWDKDTSDKDTSAGGTGLTTIGMQTKQTFLNTGWDFNMVWAICDGTNYPRLRWQPVSPMDFVCPDGVGTDDLNALAGEWLYETQIADMAPDGGDGFVDLVDWQHLAGAWMTTSASGGWDAACDLAPPGGDGTVDLLDAAALAEAWLAPSARFCDIAPPPDGDGKVNLLDFAAFADYWMRDDGL